MALPKIIQGGMGVAVSAWKLANAVSQRGQLGVVSGTGIGIVMVSRLMYGDEGGHVRRALAHFPLQDVAERLIKKYYIEGGLPEGQSYKQPQMWTVKPSKNLLEVTVAANFVEVWLGKEGHENPVGINLLEKVQLPNLASLYGAMLAGVDYVLMGAGIPMQIPGASDNFVTHQAAEYRLDVTGAGDESVIYTFDPQKVFPDVSEIVGNLKRPQFLPIVSSSVLALALKKRANGEINGFIIEMPVAGGHNAPPRGEYPINERGEPVYGEKDEVNLNAFRKLELPFWLAGGYGSPEKLQEALAEGAQGIQVGTAFAYCDESGFDGIVREKVVAQVLEDDVDVLTSAVASPTGFPFKVVQLAGTVSDPEVYAARERICDIGYLRHLYKDNDGHIGYRCPAEPVDAYIKKGGTVEETCGRVCLCNHLGAAAGLPQVRKGGYREPVIVTSGDDLPYITRFIPQGQAHYSADDVLNVLLGE
jgi:nitronate monooxygenase